MPKKPRGPITVEESTKLLEADPEWVARRKTEDEWYDARRRRLRKNQEPILRELRAVGYDLDSVWDLVNTREPYPEAIPVLISHLGNLSYDPKIREGLARALTDKDAKTAVPELIEAFRKDPDTSLLGPKWALANAIIYLADASYLDVMIELALDQSHGAGRAALVERIRRFKKNAKAQEALDILVDDPVLEVRLHAQKGRR